MGVRTQSALSSVSAATDSDGGILAQCGDDVKQQTIQNENKKQTDSIVAASDAIRHLSTKLSGRHSRMKGGRVRGKGIPHFSAWICKQVSHTSSAATAQAPVDALDMGTSASFTEMSSFAGLFDLCRCTEWKVQATLNCPVTNTVEVECGVAFDPVNPGTFSSALNSQLTTQHMYFVLPPVNASGGSDGIQLVTKNGIRTISGRTVTGTVVGPGQAVVGGGWAQITNSSIIAGYIKSFVDAAAVGSTILTLNIFMNVEFKSRT
jgi:hypothetical protein